MAKGGCEGYSTVRALGLSVAPFALRVLFTWLPPAFAIYYWRRFFASKMADYVFGRHARAALREMRALANDCRSLLEKSRIEAPALHQLYCAIDAYGRCAKTGLMRCGKFGEVTRCVQYAYRFRCGASQSRLVWSTTPQHRSPKPSASSPRRHRR
jgi:hypothetical protein